MKTKRPSWPYLLALGMCCLCGPKLVQFLMPVNIRLNDFLIGFGVALSIGAVFIAGKEHRTAL